MAYFSEQEMTRRLDRLKRCIPSRLGDPRRDIGAAGDVELHRLGRLLGASPRSPPSTCPRSATARRQQHNGRARCVRIDTKGEEPVCGTS